MEPRRILVIRNRFIGDTILAIPFLRNLRRHFPRAVIDVLVEHGSGEVLAHCPYKNELIVWADAQGRRSSLPKAVKAFLATAHQLRGRRYDCAYVLKRSLSSALLSAVAGIPRRTGFAGPFRRLLLTQAIRPDSALHEAEQFLALLEADGLDVDDGHNENWTPPHVEAFTDSVMPPRRGPRIFVAPCSTAWEKQWPLERVAGVLSWLIRTLSADVFLCGAQGDAHSHGLLRDAVGAEADRVHDMSLHVPLGSLAGLLSRMDLFLGVDTGLMHVAASVGVPIVALFGPFDENRWRPFGAPHRVIRSRRPCVPCNLTRPCPIEAACMKDIGVQEVLVAIQEMLGRRTA